MQTLRDSWVIYGLIDQRIGQIRYVGYTQDLKIRLYQHIYNCNATESHKNRWIRSLIRAGEMPVAVVLEQGNGDWRQREIAWIKALTQHGCKLTNSTMGGDGASGLCVSEETRRKIGQHSRETKQWVNCVEAAIRSNIGRKQRQESIDKRVEKMRGRSHSEETKRKIREKALGRIVSEETKKKMSDARRGRKASLEARAAISKGLKGHVVSTELREKFSRDRIGVPWSEKRRNQFNERRLANASDNS